MSPKEFTPVQEKESPEEFRSVESFAKNKDIQQAMAIDPELRTFVHDICAKDVRLICTKEIRHTFLLPGANGLAPGCRGGRVITDPFPAECVNVRVTCAQEDLAPDCMSVENVVGLEIVLRSLRKPHIFFVINDTITFSCKRFHKVPVPIPVEGEALADALRFIDGSCKMIFIKRCEVINTECPRVEVDLLVADKLWKFENLLLLAAAPFPRDNITVCQLFNEFHRIERCPPDDCSSPADA